MLNATTTAGAQLRNLVIIALCVALLAGINVVFNDYIIRVISTIFVFMILAVSYNLINGVTGQLSLEPNGFVAVGAYVTALLILPSDSKLDMFEMAAPSPWILVLHAGFLPALLISGLCAAALLLQYGQEPEESCREIAPILAKNLTKSQIMRTIELLQKYRGECTYNVGTGHVLGAIAVELEGIL